MDGVKQYGFQILPLPPFSPDYVPTDYYLFPKLTIHLHGKWYSDDNEMDAEQVWSDSQKSDQYMNAICALVMRWIKCIDLQGNYVE